jgi:hypothetical protein
MQKLIVLLALVFMCSLATAESFVVEQHVEERPGVAVQWPLVITYPSFEVICDFLNGWLQCTIVYEGQPLPHWKNTREFAQELYEFIIAGECYDAIRVVSLRGENN